MSGLGGLRGQSPPVDDRDSQLRGEVSPFKNQKTPTQLQEKLNLERILKSRESDPSQERIKLLLLAGAHHANITGRTSFVIVNINLKLECLLIPGPTCSTPSWWLTTTVLIQLFRLDKRNNNVAIYYAIIILYRTSQRASFTT